MRAVSLSQYGTSITFYNNYFHLSQKYKFTAVICVSYLYVPCWGWGNAIFSRYIGLAEFFWCSKFSISILDCVSFFFFGWGGGGSEKFGYEDFCGYFL